VTFPRETGRAASGVGAGAHWQANLDLSFERRDGRTVLTGNLHKGPLQVQKALYPEGGGTCHIAILHPPGGIAAGDRLSVGASLGGGSRALLTTPGATKWYRSEGEWARQAVRFDVLGDAVLEWLPRENIFFDEARISSTLDVALSPDAAYFGWDIMSFGRRASGESWRAGCFELRSAIRRDGRFLWSEVANVDAGSGFAQSPVGLAGMSVCGTFVVAGYEVANGLLAECRQIKPARAAGRIGITCVPEVLIARYLGDSTEEAFDWFNDLWAVLRPALTARAACPPRVWAC
jgi:urease accessory protein